MHDQPLPRATIRAPRPRWSARRRARRLHGKLHALAVGSALATAIILLGLALADFGGTERNTLSWNFCEVNCVCIGDNPTTALCVINDELTRFENALPRNRRSMRDIRSVEFWMLASCGYNCFHGPAWQEYWAEESVDYFDSLLFPSGGYWQHSHGPRWQSPDHSAK